jgi:hypothetical protein
MVHMKGRPLESSTAAIISEIEVKKNVARRTGRFAEIIQKTARIFYNQLSSTKCTTAWVILDQH